jgi:tetratricopeptide (TPR) repeat protein
METQGIELDRSSATPATSRRWKLVMPVLSIALALCLGGWRLWHVGRYQQALAEVNELMAAGRHGMAARNLGLLLARKPGWDEANYLLGACERARGRPDEASEAWARVPPDSPFWGRATQGRTELKIERGLLGDAEQLVIDAQKNAPDHGFTLNALLAPIYCQQGRFEEAGRLIEAEWDQMNQNGEGASEKAINLVRMHTDLERKIAPPEVIRSYLEQAARLSPKDDRVWLGRANLAIRDGSFEQAAGLLNDCLRERPDNIAVWRAKLSLAIATNQLATALEALKHLPFDECAPVQIPKLAAWIARQHGDLDAERRALELVIEAVPADFSALMRLAELAEKAGQPERVAEVQKQKNEIERLQNRYEQLYNRNQPIRDAVEMAQLAAQLGHGFEARAFLTVALAEDPGRNDLREKLRRLSRPRSEPSAVPRRTLAQILASELAPPADPSLESSNGNENQ